MLLVVHIVSALASLALPLAYWLPHPHRYTTPVVRVSLTALLVTGAGLVVTQHASLAGTCSAGLLCIAWTIALARTGARLHKRGL